VLALPLRSGASVAPGQRLWAARRGEEPRTRVGVARWANNRAPVAAPRSAVELLGLAAGRLGRAVGRQAAAADRSR
jgi:hypothetical protein